MGAQPAPEPMSATPLSATPLSATLAGRCAVQALALNEPLAGTAPFAPRWLCVEQRCAWPSDVTAHPDPGLNLLARRAEEAGWRLLLIRRPGRRTEPASDKTGPSQVFLADTTPPHPQITAMTVSQADLADLPLPTANLSLPGTPATEPPPPTPRPLPGTPATEPRPPTPQPLPGTPVTEPLLLICTHGRRDRCCAVDGRALALAITGGCADLSPHVWECTHLGGHRFAPTALVLPTGYLYGRLDATAAIEARKAAGHGEAELALCRGRSTWPPEAQVAELAVRQATGLRDASAPSVQGLGDGDVLVTAVDGRRWAVEITQEVRGDGRPTSCGVDPAPIAALHATALRALA